MSDRLVHIDAPTWFDAETGDVTDALDRDAMTPEEIAHLELTGMFDPKHLVRIPQDDGDGSMYNPEIVARVLEAAANPWPETFTAEEMIEHVRRLADQ